MRGLSFVVASGCLALTCYSALASDVVAARTLRIGAIIEKTDLTIESDEAETVASQIVGKELKRAVYVGRSISKSDVGPITIVDRNDVIRLFYQVSGLGIRTEARALEAGGLGEEISVMNLETRVTVRARVTGSKRARVAR